MGEIKFRAWHTEEKKMYHFGKQSYCSEYQLLSFKLQEKQSGSYCFDFDEDYLSPIMQFTGLKDKNGKEVYEGDIISHLNIGETELLLWAVKFVTTEYNSFCDFGMMPRLSCCEVIGNIYENPELLKEKAGD